MDENASGASDQDQTASVSRVTSLHEMWQDLNGPSPIQWTLLNRNDSHL